MINNRVRITHITGARSSADRAVLSGTVIVHISLRPVQRNGELVVLSVSTDLDRRAVARTSANGSASLVVDTAALPNGLCDITVSDLQCNEATHHVRIDNPISEAGHFYYRDGLKEQSKSIPNLPDSGRYPPAHSTEYYSFFPIICSDTDTFQINFRAAKAGVYLVELRDIRGNLVRRLPVKSGDTTQKGVPDRGQHHWYVSTEWDSKDRQGRITPDGDYLVQVILPNQSGTTYPLGILHKAVAPKLAPPRQTTASNTGLRFAALKENSYLRGNVLMQVASESLQKIPEYVFLLLDGEPVAASAPVRGQKRIPLALDTARFANGNHTLELRDFQGHYARLSVFFQNELSQVQFEPVFDLNTGGNGPRISYFTATLPQAYPWRVELVNRKGKAIRSFKGDGKTILLAWDGNDDWGKRAPLGYYEIALYVANRNVSSPLGFIDLHVSEE